MKHIFKLQFLRFHLLLFLVLKHTLSCSSSDNNIDGSPNPSMPPSGESVASFWVTNLDQSLLLQKQNTLSIDPKAHFDETITLDQSKNFQEMDGFGFALTEGSAMLMSRMSRTERNNLLQELFGQKEDQLGISYLRIAIGASDMVEELYFYSDLPDGKIDLELESFSLSRDTLYLIPIIKDILTISPDIKFVATPWSAPIWMKDSKDSKGGSLIKQYYPTYANYFVKYIQAMQSEGIEIDAITVQNESLWDGNNPSMLMLAREQAEFVKNHLGPAFEEHNIKSKILIYDHNPDRIDYPLSVLRDPDAAKYINGTAFHLYDGEIDALTEVHNAFPNKDIYFTEQWTGYPSYFDRDMSWHMKNVVVGATQNWAKNVILWNLASDENQEPHTDRGGCYNCLGAVTISGNSVERNVSYYIIGHISMFVKPRAKRIASTKSLTNVNTAFLNLSGEQVIIIQNTSSSQRRFRIKSGEKEMVIPLLAGSVATVVINK